MTKTFKQIREGDVPKDHEYGPSSRKRPAGKKGYTSSDSARTTHLKTVKKYGKKKRRQGDKELRESVPWEYVMGNLTKDDKDTLQDFSDNFGPRVGGNIKYATKYAVDKILANTEKNLQKLSPAGKKAYKDFSGIIGAIDKKMKEIL